MSTLRVVALAALTALMVVAAGCASSGGADPAALEGTWVLESFGGTDALTPADPAVTSVLTMAANKASGNGGVNSFSGSYEANDDMSLTFGPLASTAMAGPDGAMQQEAKFFAALEATRNFEINEGKLVLSDLGNNTLLVFVSK